MAIGVRKDFTISISIMICISIIALIVASFLLYRSNKYSISCNDVRIGKYLKLIGSISECDNKSVSEALWISIKDNSDGYKYFVYFPRLKYTEYKPKKIIVRVPGGPGDSTHLPWDKNKPKYLSWLKWASKTCNAPIVNLSYTGTAPRQSWPREGLDTAKADVRQWIDEINKAYGADNVIIISESLGPYVLLSSGINLRKNKMMLVEPLTISPNEWNSRLYNEKKSGGFFINHRRKYRIFNEKTSKWEWKYLSSGYIFDPFFDEKLLENDKNLVSFLDSPPYKGISIIYSRKERMISADFDKEFTKAQVNFIALDGLLHGMPFDSPSNDKKMKILHDWIEGTCH